MEFTYLLILRESRKHCLVGKAIIMNVTIDNINGSKVVKVQNL